MLAHFATNIIMVRVQRHELPRREQAGAAGRLVMVVMFPALTRQKNNGINALHVNNVNGRKKGVVFIQHACSCRACIARCAKNQDRGGGLAVGLTIW